ncbi:endoglucanase E-4-like isoform X2 [Arctopsyche grandis]|uniref:endoglucanase E-4-like isoform X2 n=1 Tax=Arctopsyche grandis TaxID=121162 RepID=UPI00406D9CFF
MALRCSTQFFRSKVYKLLVLTVGLLIVTCFPAPSDSLAVPRSLIADAEVLSNSKYDYEEALRMSLLFYEAQRSGKLPEDNRIPWRGDSALEDRGLNGEDLTGGYYDAGDYVKFVWTQAAASTMIAWGIHSAPLGYIKSGELSRGLDCLRWASDFLLKCHVAPEELYGQVGDFRIDQKFWGRPEDMNMTRPAYKIDAEKPGSDLAGEVAAALAATSLVFREHGDVEYADLCLLHAKELYQFARNHRGLYHLSMKAAAQYYESTDYGDELAWAAAWLYKATNISYYLDEADHFYNTFRLKERPNEFSLGRRVAGVQVLMMEFTGRRDLKAAVTSFCDYQTYHQRRTPKGLLCIEREGALSHAANVVFLCMQAAKLGISPKKYENLAKQQINYMLGDSGRSFVVGFGKNPPLQPHHASSSCPMRPETCGWENFRSKDPNPQILYGALVSGPNENDLFIDLREEFIYTEVTIDYNAGFQSALAMLIHLSQDPKSIYYDSDANKSTDNNLLFGDSKQQLEIL